MKKRMIVGGLAAGFTLAALLAPAGAGTPGGLVVSGTATCNLATGHETWTLEWTATNDGTGAANIDSATESGAWDGSVTLEPNPVTPGSSASGSDGPVPNANVGTVTLTVEYTQQGTPLTAMGSVTLDGSCTDTPPTSETTTTPSTGEVRAETIARPSFTG